MSQGPNFLVPNPSVLMASVTKFLTNVWVIELQRLVLLFLLLHTADLVMIYY